MNFYIFITNNISTEKYFFYIHLQHKSFDLLELRRIEWEKTSSLILHETTKN